MTIMREALLRAAYTSDDDSERLVYADWLEQHGEVARAQVVHLQCKRARISENERAHRELGWELDAALAELGTAWQEELPVLEGVEWTALARGLPSAVRVRDVGTLLASAEAIHAAAPTVDHVELGRCEFGQDVAEIPWLRVLAIRGQLAANPVLDVPAEIELDIGEYAEAEALRRERPLSRLAVQNNACVGDELADVLATRSWARSLVALEMPTRRSEVASYYDADPQLSASGARQLTGLTELQTLSIDRHGVGSKAVERLFALPALRSLSARETATTELDLRKAKGAPLVRLDLSKNALGDAGARAIAQAPRLRALERLELDTCEIEAVGLHALVESPLWSTLRWLDLSRNPLGVAGARVLAQLAKPAMLHTLLLADADLDDSAANALGKLAWLGELVELDLAGNPLGRGAIALRGLAADGLRKLSLSSCAIERTEAAAIARFWPSVVHLDLAHNALTDAGIERFATMKEARLLQSLSLADCQLTADGIELLAERARCPRLRTLVLAGNQPTGPALAALLGSPLVQRLGVLDLSRCTLDDEAVTTLARTPVPSTLQRLALGGNVFDERQLLALADSPTLRSVEKIELEGNPYGFEPRTRERLAQRFGRGWYQR
ncbi:MAG TPA: TIGR02996 domain-containing protein [Kofleriaceae bacterium]|nr:TIGR02996 domain-containing protein [Kofleriaceae bacterium]